MHLAVSSALNQFPQARRSRFIDSGCNSSSPSVQEEQLKLPHNEETLHNENNRTGLIRRHSLDSIDTSPRISNIPREYLDELKRRSLPYQPQRSSSLTFPPEIPPESTPSSPTDTTGSRGRELDEAFSSHRRSWGEWWRGVVTGRRQSQAPIPNHERSSENGRSNVPMDDDMVDVAPSGEGMSSDIYESLDSTTIPTAEVKSSRYLTPLRKLWTMRGRPIWRPAVHPVVYGFRSSGGDFHHLETPLDVGCEVLGGPSKFGTRVPEKPTAHERTEADSDIYDEGSDTLGIASGCGSDDDDYYEPSSHIENAEAAGHEDGWQGVPVMEGIDPTTPDPGSGVEPAGNPPPTPRPAHRSLPFVSNTLHGAARPSETTSESRRRAFSDAALLMNLRFERRFGSTAQEPVPRAAQHRAESLPRHQNDPSRRVTFSVEEIDRGASSWETGEASGAVTESERADLTGYEHGSFRSLERVRSYRNLSQYI